MACDPYQIGPFIKKIMISRSLSPDDEHEHQHEQPDVRHGDMRLEPIPAPDDHPPSFASLIVKDVSALNISLFAPDSETTPRFHVVISVFTPHTPHVTLHDGPDKLSPVLGVAHLAHFGRNTVGLGDPGATALGVVWETLERTTRWRHATYRFEFLFGEQGRTAFVWERGHWQGMDDQAPMHLFEEGRPDVVLARFEANGFFRWRERGRFLIREGLGEAWMVMVLLTGLSLLELSRRRAGKGRRGAFLSGLIKG